jgi:hypothetical protein
MTYRYISNFARTKGAKDKQERKKRGVGGYLAAGTGVGLAGQLASRNLDNRAAGAYMTGLRAYGNSTNATKVANSASKLAKEKNILADSMQGSGQKFFESAARKEAFEAGGKANRARQAATKYANLGEKAMKSGTKLGRYGKAAKIAGLAGAAGLAGVAGYNYARNRQDERQSLGGQAKMLKNKIKERLNKR